MTQAEIDGRVRFGDPDPCARDGRCGDCYGFREPEVSDWASAAQAHDILVALRGFGVCLECPDSPVIVSRREQHAGTSLGGCWGPR